jgi:hypothetical protein
MSKVNRALSRCHGESPFRVDREGASATASHRIGVLTRFGFSVLHMAPRSKPAGGCSMPVCRQCLMSSLLVLRDSMHSARLQSISQFLWYAVCNYPFCKLHVRAICPSIALLH